MQNNIYNQRLESILQKYDVYLEGFNNDAKKIYNTLVSILRERCNNKKIAFWGVGSSIGQKSHVSVLTTEYISFINGEIKCIIDSWSEFWGKKVSGITVVSPDEAKKQDIDLIIITSRSSVNSIVESINKCLPGCEYLDIYGELANKGIKIYHEFFKESSAYVQLYEAREQYENEVDLEKKAQALKQLIALYFHIRDMHYALHFIDEYIQHGFNKKEQYVELKQEIECLIDEIKKANEDKKDNIIAYYVDALRPMDVYNRTKEKTQFNILNSYMQGGTYFTNMYATSATTYESLCAIIAEKLPFEENVYEGNQHYNFDEFRLLKRLHEEGYEINIYTIDRFRFVNPTEKVNFYIFDYMTDKIWEMACHNAVSNKKTFSLLYFIYEMHIPLICGYHKNRPQSCTVADIGNRDIGWFIEDQMEDCKEYLDVELEYYRAYFPSDMKVILFSDHSQVVYDKKEQKPFFTYYNNPARSTNAIMALSGGKGVVHREINELASLIDFNEILESFIFDNEVNVPKREIVQYQYYPIKSKYLRDVAIEKGYKDYIDGINCFISLKYLYIITGTGKEEVYILEDLGENIIETEEGRSFRHKVVQEYDTSFPKFLVTNKRGKKFE